MDVVLSRRRGSPLLRTPFTQPRQPAFWLYLVIVAATGFVSISEQALFRRISPSGWVLSWGLLALYALPVLTLVYLLDLYEKEPVPSFSRPSCGAALRRPRSPVWRTLDGVWWSRAWVVRSSPPGGSRRSRLLRSRRR